MHAKRLLTLILLFAAIFSALPLTGIAADSSRYETRTENIIAVLTLSAAPLKSMQAIPFQLEVKNLDGTAMKGLNFECSLTMPAMAMPPNNPKVTQKGDLYTGSAIFTMAGAWQATFKAEKQDNGDLKLVFDIPTVLMK